MAICYRKPILLMSILKVKTVMDEKYPIRNAFFSDARDAVIMPLTSELNSLEEPEKGLLRNRGIHL